MDITRRLGTVRAMKCLRLSAPQHLEWIEAPEPPAPGPGQALVAVRHIGICGTDVSGYLGKMPFIEMPRVLGHELGVEVLAAGEGVEHVAPGDRCAVEPYLNCGRCHPCLHGRTNCCETLEVLGVHRDGGMCERLLLPAAKLHPSRALSLEQLALVETLGIGCHAVDRARISAEDSVLIIGAGPIGLAVLEFARLAAREVAIIELSDARRRFVEAHHPGVQVLSEAPAGYQARAVFDATGNPRSMAAALHLAAFGGRVTFVGITKDPVALDDPLFHRRELTLLASRNALPADFTRIIRLVEEGKIDTRPWISHRARFEDLPDALPRWIAPGSGVIKAMAALAP